MHASSALTKSFRNTSSAETIEICEKFVVTFRTVCWDGMIKICTDTATEDSISVSSDFMDLDSEEEDEEEGASYIDLTRKSGSKWEEKMCRRDDKKPLLKKQPDGNSKVTPMEEDVEEEVPVAEYASEENVHTTPEPLGRCTNVDIDRCVGRLLESQYKRQKRITILDRDSILDLQAKSCALEAFPQVSNEVEVGLDSDTEYIPLSNNFVHCTSEGATKVARHMLSSREKPAKTLNK